MPRLSGVDLAMTGMPGMANHAPMKIGGATTAVGEDGKTLIVTLARPLTAGSYKVDWHAAAADTPRIVGSLTFTVRCRMDSSLVAIRCSLYAALVLLFGFLLFPLYALLASERDRLLLLRWLSTVFAGLGIVLSGLS